ncbi:ATP-binding protein [Leptolyngbya sp. PCC 6406]|uniref:ATP-binding protein n=1 Tax=Leptolyngbya sp. PCC 6406 TaxID=1173264 RepID=UPI0004818ABD|nr:ATP-binding protein [Leptolyngbya sp. PCC 6406]
MTYGKAMHLVVESRLEALLKVQRWFKEVCTSLEAEMPWVRDRFDYLNLALAEGFTNAVRHAHAALPPETPIDIEVSLAINRVDIHIWDRGQPFDPTGLPEPEPGSLSQTGGYGWFLLRRVTDEVSYRRTCDRNCLAITQYAPP